MGNCLGHKSTSTLWGGDEWGSLESKRCSDDANGEDKDSIIGMEKLKLLGERRSSGSEHDNWSSNSFSSTTGDHHGTEVKIRVRRKELEKLVGAQDKALSVEQLLSQLINGGDLHHRLDLGPHHLEHDDQRPWRPVLQSIPEVD